MNNTSMLNICASVLVAIFVEVADAQAPTDDQRYANYKLFENVSSNIANWFNDAISCDVSIVRMLSESTDKASSSFVAAKYAWLTGHPSRAINILHQVITDNGSDKMPGFNFPVRVASFLWIGTISRHYGDAMSAKSAYNELMSSDLQNTREYIGVITSLYGAEIDYQMLMRKEDALLKLNDLEKMEIVDQSTMGDICRLYKEWGSYQRALLEDGFESARKTLKGNPDRSKKLIESSIFHLNMVGLAGESRIDQWNNTGEILLIESMERAIECRTSAIDNNLARLWLGYYYEQKNKAEKAEYCYKELFETNSFLAPEGGVALARCQKKQGKDKEASDTLAKVKEQFPGYADYVNELSK